MIHQFSIKPIPELHFGAGCISIVPQLIGKYTDSTLVVVGESSYHRSQIILQLIDKLREQASILPLVHIAKEPSPTDIDDAVRRYGDNSIGAVIGIGGGSVLDAGKAVAAMLATGGSVIEYLEGVGQKTPPGKTIPFIAVPTTAGTGSEMTSNAVISQVGENGFKKSLRHDNYIPDCAVVDPELAMECSRTLSANCAMDAFTQLVESYLSTKATPFTDDLAFGAISRLQPSLSRIAGDGLTLTDRTNLAYAACISGITLTNVGLGVVHGFASVLGGLFQIPHGVVCGTLMAPANKITLNRLRVASDAAKGLGKYTKLGRLFSDKEQQTDMYYQDCFVDKLHQLTTDMQIDSLSAYGVQKSETSSIAKRTSVKNNPIELTHEDLEDILEKRLE